MKHQLVGLTGRKGSGKDTAAEVLYGVGFHNVKFAGALKDMLRCVLAYQGVDPTTVERMVEGDLKEVETPYLSNQTPRWAMQSLGTEWGRELIGDNFWVDVTMTKAVGRKSVITDCRFPNEAAAIKAAGGLLVRIVDPDFTPTGHEHPSEALIDTFPTDLEICNRKGTRQDLQAFQLRFLSLLNA